VLAIIAPGQGSQTPGMLNSWIQDPTLKKLIASWSDAIDLDLLHLGTNADADEIKDTTNAQPLIVATSLLAAHALEIKNLLFITSGHSVGELAAAALSGAISEIDALRIVRARGIEMAKAAATSPSGMSAILGGDRTEVLAAIAVLNLVAANDNGAGQIVAAGDLQALASLNENPPAGARVRALAVAGAFHTGYMKPAVEPVRELASSIATHSVSHQVISNKDGRVVTNAPEVLNRIVEQIASPVRWDLCMETMKTMGVTGVIELPPAGTLVGLLKRAASEIETFALKSADDVQAAREFAERHA
jgi:[acyl-carrier-protein] S-malonyltransferase